jgi:hypothetical protein
MHICFHLQPLCHLNSLIFPLILHPTDISIVWGDSELYLDLQTQNPMVQTLDLLGSQS